MNGSYEAGDWVQVAEVGQLWQAELIAGRLRASGIEAEIVDQTFHQEPIPDVRSFALVRVLVPKDQQERADRLLADPPPAPSDHAEPAEDDEIQ